MNALCPPRDLRTARRRTLLAVIVALLCCASSLYAQDAEEPKAKKPSLHDRFVDLDAKGDSNAIVALWRENPDRIVPVIDQDLEGSLALWEKEGGAKAAEGHAMVARAIRGAHAAVTATGRRRILDYVTSFAGWTADEKKRFREGQAAFRGARGEMKEKRFDAALTLGQRCRELAEPLGDWWGTAMGLQAEGAALRALDRREAAVTALSRARLIYRELGLTGSALRIETDLAALLIELGRLPRAHALVIDGLATARRLGADDLLERFRELEAMTHRAGLDEDHPKSGKGTGHDPHSGG